MKKKYSIKNQLLNEDAFAIPKAPESLTADEKTEWQKFWNDITDRDTTTVATMPKFGKKQSLFNKEFDKFKTFSDVKKNTKKLSTMEKNYIEKVDPEFTPNELNHIKSKIDSIAKDSLTDEEKNAFISSIETMPLKSRKVKQLTKQLKKWYPKINDTNLKDMINQSIEKQKFIVKQKALSKSMTTLLKKLPSLRKVNVRTTGFKNFRKTMLDLFSEDPTIVPSPIDTAALRLPLQNNKFWEALKEICAAIDIPIPMDHNTNRNLFKVNWNRLKSEINSYGQTFEDLIDIDNAIATNVNIEIQNKSGEWKLISLFDFEKYDDSSPAQSQIDQLTPIVPKGTLNLKDEETISSLQTIKNNNDSDIDIGPISLQLPLNLINDYKNQLIQNFTSFINTSEAAAENKAFSFDVSSQSELQSAVLLKMMFTALQVKDSRKAGPLTERFAEIMTGGKGLNSGFQSNFVFADLLIADNIFVSVKYSKAGLSANRMKRDAITKITEERLYQYVKKDKPVYLGIIYMTASGSKTKGNYVRMSTGLCALEDKGGVNSTIENFQDSLGDEEAEWGDTNLRSSTNINDFYIYLPSNKKLSEKMEVSINEFDSLYQDLFLYNKNIFNTTNPVVTFLKNDAIAIREKGRYTANIIGDYLINHLDELDNPNVFKFWKDINNKIGVVGLNENYFHSFSLKYLFEIKEVFKTGKWSFRFTNFISSELPPLDEIEGPKTALPVDYNSLITSTPSELSLKTRHLIFENILLYCLYYGSKDPKLGYSSERMYDETENLTRTFFGGSNTNSSILLNDNSAFCDVAFFESEIPSFYSVKWNKDATNNFSKASAFYKFGKDLSQIYLPDTLTKEKNIRIGWVEWSLAKTTDPTIIIKISHEDVWLKNKRLYKNSGLKSPMTGEYKTKANQIECSIILLKENVMLDCLKKLGVTLGSNLQETIRNIILNINTSVLGTTILSSSNSSDSKTFSGSFESKIEKLVDNLNGQDAKTVREELEKYFKNIGNVISVLKDGEKNGLSIDEKYRKAKLELNKNT